MLGDNTLLVQYFEKSKICYFSNFGNKKPVRGREHFYISSGASHIFLFCLELEIISFEDFKKFKFEIAVVGLAAPGNLGKTHETLLKC